MLAATRAHLTTNRCLSYTTKDTSSRPKTTTSYLGTIDPDCVCWTLLEVSPFAPGLGAYEVERLCQAEVLRLLPEVHAILESRP